MSDLVGDFTDALLSLDRFATKELIADMTHTVSPLGFVEDVVVVALERIGQAWQEGKVSLAQVYMAGRICEQLIDEILPPASPERKDQPKMAICTLIDQHKLGKMIVYSLLRASGFELSDFNTLNVEDLVTRVQDEGIKVLLISVLMLPSALKIKNVKNLLDKNDLNVKIIVGGAPFRFDKNLWREVDADGICGSASEAAGLVNQIMKEIE